MLGKLATFLAGGLVGVVATLAVVIVGGGWYEYLDLRVTPYEGAVSSLINRDGWQHASDQVEQFYYLRRPRVRIAGQDSYLEAFIRSAPVPIYSTQR